MDGTVTGRKGSRGELTSSYLFYFALIAIVLLVILAVYMAISKGLFSLNPFG